MRPIDAMTEDSLLAEKAAESSIQSVRKHLLSIYLDILMRLTHIDTTCYRTMSVKASFASGPGEIMGFGPFSTTLTVQTAASTATAALTVIETPPAELKRIDFSMAISTP